ncbi:MAG TPA: hypothetical protein VGG29_15050 [Caulobacteraceae bacterium]
MRLIWALLGAFVALNLAGCAGYHQEVAALRMPRPAAEPAELAAYARPSPAYPSVGGDILKGTAPHAAAAYDATSGERVPPPSP